MVTAGAGLQVRELTVVYHHVATGVNGVSLTVGPGEMAAIVGPNGAGKTSTLRGIAGFLPRESGAVKSGEVRLDGRRVNGLPVARMARLGVAMVPERDKVFTELTVAENLRLAGRRLSKGEFRTSMEQVLAVFPLVEQHLERLAGYLSGGERQMVALASALMGRPRLLLVDELSQGLSPGVVASLADSLRQINAGGLTVLVVEQNPALAAELAERLYILDGGRLVAAGTAEELRHQGEIARTYLGVAIGGLGANGGRHGDDGRPLSVQAEESA